MGMSMHVYGYRPADDQWRKMKAAWDSCRDAGVDPPDEVNEFLNSTHPGDKPGTAVEIEGNAAKKWSDDYRDGYEVDLSALPEGVRFIRFYCAW